MSPIAEKYFNILNTEFDKIAGRGDFMRKLITTGSSKIKDMVPASFFSKPQNKLLNTTGHTDKIINTSETLGSMVKAHGVAPRVPGITGSIQADYTKLLRDRINKLKGQTGINP